MTITPLTTACVSPPLAVLANAMYIFAVTGFFLMAITSRFRERLFGDLFYRPKYKYYIGLSINVGIRAVAAVIFLSLVSLFVSPFFLPEMFSDCLTPITMG